MRCGAVNHASVYHAAPVGRLYGFFSSGVAGTPAAPDGVLPFCIRATHHHIIRMAKEHPHAEATYRVIPLKDLTFGVEVNVPGSFPAMVTSFATEETAEAWIADYKQRVAANVSYKFMRRRSSRT